MAAADSKAWALGPSSSTWQSPSNQRKSMYSRQELHRLHTAAGPMRCSCAQMALTGDEVMVRYKGTLEAFRKSRLSIRADAIRSKTRTGRDCLRLHREPRPRDLYPRGGTGADLGPLGNALPSVL